MNQLNPEKNNIIIARFNPASLPKFQWAQEKRVIYASIVFLKKTTGLDTSLHLDKAQALLNSTPAQVPFFILLF